VYYVTVPTFFSAILLASSRVPGREQKGPMLEEERERKHSQQRCAEM
jgi:hypothetical protein